ncbi:MAG TPA: S46 family peptidase [Longimicrobiales bacterium]|nr:S46 family peptidase [Longimicrobiales bacterium]
MRKARLVYTAILLLALFGTKAQAQLTSKANLPAGYRPEFGTMWTFENPPLDYWKTRYNWTPDQAWLDHARLSSIRLPGCSASFVSENGLVMTNHHCARSCTAAVAPADTDYMKTGFVAPNVADEKKCPGLFVDQLVGIEDVTSRIQGKVTASNSAKRVEQRDAEIAAIQRDCSTGGLTCQVTGLYQGGIYSLYKYRRYNDLRLVFAPEEHIAFYGGDPDNFTYPRYDIDVTLLRVYENNQPSRPQHFLKWSANGAQDGELVFVIGNPGGTGRLNTVAQMEYLRDIGYPGQLATFTRQINILKELSSRSEAARRQYNNTLFGAQNSFKAITGYLGGLTNENYMKQKRTFEKDFRARIAKDPKLAAQYGSAWGAIAAAEDSLRQIAMKQRYYGFTGSTYANIASGLVRVPLQEALADSLRLPNYRGNALNSLKAQLGSPQLQIDTAFERANTAAWLRAMQSELDAKDPVLVAVLAGRTPEQAAADLIKGTQLGNADFRKTLISGGTAAIQQSTDPYIVLARGINTRYMPVATKVNRLNSVISANAEKIGQAVYAAYGKALPPDATFTLRISDGIVAGYPYNGTIAPYKTSFYGLFARNAEFDNKGDFELPARWLARRSQMDLSTPLDFVTTNDIIGGNSGSPVINRNGEVVGLTFDGNIESVSNRFFFSDEVMRAVHVHSRAIPETIRNVFGAPRLADELEGKK